MDLIKYYPQTNYLSQENHETKFNHNNFEYDKYDPMIFYRVVYGQRLAFINNEVHGKITLSKNTRVEHTVLTIQWNRGQIIHLDKITNGKLVASIRTEKPGTGVYKFRGYMSENHLRYDLGTYGFHAHRIRGSNFEISFQDNMINKIQVNDLVIFDGKFISGYEEFISSTKVDFKLNYIDLIVEIN